MYTNVKPQNMILAFISTQLNWLTQTVHVERFPPLFGPVFQYQITQLYNLSRFGFALYYIQ